MFQRHYVHCDVFKNKTYKPKHSVTVTTEINKRKLKLFLYEREFLKKLIMKNTNMKSNKKFDARP